MFIYGWIILISLSIHFTFLLFSEHIKTKASLYSFSLPICAQENFCPSNVLFLEPALWYREHILLCVCWLVRKALGVVSELITAALEDSHPPASATQGTVTHQPQQLGG